MPYYSCSQTITEPTTIFCCRLACERYFFHLLQTDSVCTYVYVCTYLQFQCGAVRLTSQTNCKKIKPGACVSSVFRKARNSKLQVDLTCHMTIWWMLSMSMCPPLSMMINCSGFIFVVVQIIRNK